MLRPSKLASSFLLFIAMGFTMTKAASQQNRRMDALPILRYEPPPNFMRSAIYPPEDYLSNQFNASMQVYPFEPFSGNMAEIFQRTLLQGRIDGRYREENVAGMPQFGQVSVQGAQMAIYANFAENRVGIVRPHMRMVIIAAGAAAIVDASTSTPELYARLFPYLNRLIQTLWVDTASAAVPIEPEQGSIQNGMAGLYRGTKPKYMAGLTFQPSYFISALHYYLFSRNGLVYRAYDQILAPGGDINHFDYDFAQRSNPSNCGLYRIKGSELWLKMGNDPPVVTAAPRNNSVTIDSVTYTRQ